MGTMSTDARLFGAVDDITDVTAALEKDTSNLALLYIGEPELQEPVASVDIVLYQATHQLPRHLVPNAPRTRD